MSVETPVNSADCPPWRTMPMAVLNGDPAARASKVSAPGSALSVRKKS
jgi:hypothetical protein